MRSWLGRLQKPESRSPEAREATPFEDLFSQCFPGVYRFIYARIQSAEAAEDLTSETFLRAWRQWPPRSTTGDTPKAWLFQIARNLVTDHYRTMQRHPTAHLSEEHDCDGSSDPGADSRLDALAARAALASLPARDQDVLSLRLAGLSNREAAHALGRGEKATEMAFLRALQRLRDRLGE
jgi:RNA polymerase sigma-70 factor (ECF subfamily)